MSMESILLSVESALLVLTMIAIFSATGNQPVPEL